MKRILNKLIHTRVRMDLRDNKPMIATFFMGLFLHAGKYNPKTEMFDEITKYQYFYNL